MNAMTRKLMTLVAVMLTFGLFSLEQTASAQSPHNNPCIGKGAERESAEQSTLPQSAKSKCKQAKGYFFDTIDLSIGGTTGTITNGGILNGTTETVYNPDFVFTPNTNNQVVSYIGDLTITTHQGELRTSNVYLYDFATGLFTVIGRINPATSTGRFAGATGVLYINGNTIGVFPDQSYPSDIAGEICLANE